MNRRQRARKLDKARHHSGHKKPSRAEREARVERFIEKMSAMTKPALQDYARSLDLVFTTKNNKTSLIDMISHRLRDNMRHNIAA